MNAFDQKIVAAKQGSLAHIASLLQRATVYTNDEATAAALDAVAYALLRQEGEVFDSKQAAAHVAEALAYQRNNVIRRRPKGFRL